MTPLEDIRKRHELEAQQRQVCPCSLCVKHEDRGALLEHIDLLEARIAGYEAAERVRFGLGESVCGSGIVGVAVDDEETVEP